jgi:dTDP-glucose 4,6-dehydratase
MTQAAGPVRGARTIRRVPYTTRAEQLLDWRPTVPSEEGFRRTVAWFAAQREASAVHTG